MTTYANVGHILLKRGNTTQSTAYTGPVGELTFDTGLNTVRAHNGSTAGGILLATNGQSLAANANVGAFQTYANLTFSTQANAATQATLINAINANITAANAAITSLTSNAAIQASILDTLTGNATTQAMVLDTLTSNAATQATTLTTLLSNAVTQQTSLTDLVANAATQAEAIANAVGTYSNSNVKSYFDSFDGNILPAANVTYSLGSSTRQWRDLWVSNNTIYIGNTPIRVDNGTLLVNGAPVSGGAYGNTQVADYLPTYTGNITAGNLTITGNLDQPNRGFGNGPGTDLYITAGHTQGCSIPGGDTIISGGLGYGGVAWYGGNVTLRTGDYYTNQWNFAYDGSLTFPTGGNLVFNSSATSIIDGVTNITANGNVTAAQYNFANGVNIFDTITGVTSINASVATSTINDESGDFSYGALSYDYAVNGVTAGGFTINYSAPLVHGNVDVNVGNVIATNISVSGNLFGDGSQLTGITASVPGQTILPTVQSITVEARPAGLFGGGQGGANVTVANVIPVIEYGVIITDGTSNEKYATGSLGSIPGTVSLNFDTGLNSTQYTVFAYVTSNAGTFYSNSATGTSGICLLAGTQIALSDGTHKSIEHITYTDKMLSWDFDRGCYAETTAMWIKQGETGSQYNLLSFSDGTTLRTFDQHRIFNKQAGAFTYPMTDATPIGTVTVNEHGQEITLIDKQVVVDTIEYYNVITDYHMNLFSDSVLTSCRFNNIYPITDMKFVKDARTLRTRAEFENVPDRFFHGLRLAEQTTNIETVEWYVNRLLSTEVMTQPELTF